LFFVHLALEKMLKAHVCRATRKVAPKIHSLYALAEKTRLTLSEEDKDVLAEMNRFNIADRYTDSLDPAPPKARAMEHLRTAEKMLKWLKNQL